MSDKEKTEDSSERIHQSKQSIFQPPSPPSYDMGLVDEGKGEYALLLDSEAADASGMRRVKRQEARYVKMQSGNNIAVLYVDACGPDERRFTILYSHGNAEDLGRIHRRCVDLSEGLACDVVAYDYSGYGRSEGRPSRKNLYADIWAAWGYTLAFHQLEEDKIVLFGRGLGTAPTVDLARKVECAGVVLQSSFYSAVSTGISPCCRKSPFRDRFKQYVCLLCL